LELIWAAGGGTNGGIARVEEWDGAFLVIESTNRDVCDLSYWPRSHLLWRVKNRKGPEMIKIILDQISLIEKGLFLCSAGDPIGSNTIPAVSPSQFFLMAK
jgi:hypothetical protein